MEHVLFLTGRLAEPALRRVLAGIADLPFSWEVREIGLQVAALMTAEMVGRRLQPPLGADRIIVPGRCRGDIAALAGRLGVPVERGPDELKDLPRHFDRAALELDLSEPGPLIFAEIVDA
ncbi:MAG: dihydropteroate synthase, partial [Burkholderiales bacterium]|nr:dihydropteroate synthase [Burkholderiales bacterium]